MKPSPTRVARAAAAPHRRPAPHGGRLHLRPASRFSTIGGRSRGSPRRCRCSSVWCSRSWRCVRRYRTTLSRRTVGVAFAMPVRRGAGHLADVATSSTFTIAPGMRLGVGRLRRRHDRRRASGPGGRRLARRSRFPLRPRLAGALYGVGAGLMSDAGWRLFCHFLSRPRLRRPHPRHRHLRRDRHADR